MNRNYHGAHWSDFRYSNWKTYPQLYVNGELVGGVDLMKEMEDMPSLTAQ